MLSLSVHSSQLISILSHIIPQYKEERAHYSVVRKSPIITASE